MAMIGEMEFASDEFTASAIYTKMGGSKIMSQQNHLILPQSSSSLSSSLILNDNDNTNSNNHNNNNNDNNIKFSHNNNNSAKAERTTPYDRNSLFFVPDHHQTPVDDDQDNCYHCENGNNTNNGRDSSVINTATKTKVLWKYYSEMQYRYVDLIILMFILMEFYNQKRFGDHISLI